MQGLGRCTAYAVFYSCLILPSIASAAVPLPPCLEGSTCLPTTGAPYDLSRFNIPAETECSWPEEPRTTTTVTVGSPAELQAAADRGNVRIVIGWTGTRSGNVTLDTSDVAIEMPNTATLDGRIQIGSRQRDVARVSWRGGNHLTGPFVLDEADDVLIYDFHSTHDAMGRYDNVNDMRCSPGGCNRAAFVSSTFAGINPDSRDSYTFYTEANPTPSQCMILANVLAEQAPGGSHVSRIQGVRQIIVVDSAFVNPDEGGTAFRFHRSVTNAFVADTHIRGRIKLDSIDAGETVSVLNGVFDNVTSYNTVHNLFAVQSPMPNTGVVRNSLVYSTYGGGGTPAGISPLANGGGNELIQWDGRSFPMPDSDGVVPNMSTIGAIR